MTAQYRNLETADNADFVILMPPVVSTFAFAVDQSRYPADTTRIYWTTTIIAAMALCGVMRAIGKRDQTLSAMIVGFAVGFAVVQVPAAVFADKDLIAPITQGDGAILGSWCYSWPALAMFFARAFSAGLIPRAERRRRLAWLVIFIIVALNVLSIIDVEF